MEGTKEKNGIQFYVSVHDGDDAGTGSSRNPFRTIQAAQAAVREVILSGYTGEITVYLRGGSYELMEPLRFGTGDAGGEQCRVTYRNASGERPVLLGGIVLKQWEPWQEGIWRTPVPSSVRFQTLYANGERVVKARLPAHGYFTSNAAEGKEDLEGMGFRKEDVPDHVDPAGLQVFVWPGRGEWNWFSETIPVRKLDYVRRYIEFERPATWEIGEGSRYYLQGSLAFLREPGQFYLNEAEGMLHYRPMSGTPDEQTVVAPVITRLIDIQGDSVDRRVAGLAFRGLTLACTDFYEDHRMMRSEPGMDNAEPGENRHGLIYIRNASDIDISSCTIRESGTCGIFLDRCAERITIVNNHIERIGYTGVYASGYAPGEGDFKGTDSPYVNKGHLITNNVIEHGGELVGHGSGIVLYQCGECDISHNRIAHMPRYGISLKGLRYRVMPDQMWGVPVTWENHWDFLFTRQNRIRHNDISDVMTDSQDGGMIESWGIGRGNRIIGNRLHHSGIHFSFGFGIYLDDASDDVEVTHNVLDHLYSTNNGKLWMAIFSKGIGNRIVNNLMVDNPDAVCAMGSQEMAGEAARDIVVERNIVSNSGHLYCFVNWSPDRFLQADHNLFWRSGEPCRVAGKLPAEPAGLNAVWGNEYEWQTWRALLDGKYDAHTLFAPPGFVNSQVGDYRLLPDSPACRLGWVPIDFSLFGPQISV
ncbi:right-handed parallel beta-helix repeat-containing protein [Paenibacillus gansuensis]|uniref:Right-handed parallel beta-helix repeat-containing protein n=1 Tax=Paenibacillus gansuensis TaxID=306542 RepID=A0ABW5PKD5_9BACL